MFSRYGRFLILVLEDARVDTRRPFFSIDNIIVVKGWQVVRIINHR